ncbi:MAG: hypothetical protein HQM15_08930 [Deltaproteobacteria bacterium]|nr:hypothetical protein [Deltaproteobacteria bacterium]
MKKIISALIIVSLFMCSSAQAFFYEAKCLVPEGKFKKCNLDFSREGMLGISFNDFKYGSLNTSFKGSAIKHIAMGEKAERRWVASGISVVAFGPVGALLLLWKKKSALFSIEYKDGKSGKAVLFGVNKKLALNLSTQLKTLSGKELNYEMRN